MEGSEYLYNISNNYNSGEGVNSNSVRNNYNSGEGVNSNSVRNNYNSNGVTVFEPVTGSRDVVVQFLSSNIEIRAYELVRHFVQSVVKVQQIYFEAAIKLINAGVIEEEIEIAGLSCVMTKMRYMYGKSTRVKTPKIIPRLNKNADMLANGEVIETKWTEVTANITDELKSN